MKLTENFNLKEFACKDGSSTPLEIVGNLTKLAINLQVLRDYVNKPITINSGYRSPSYNEKIGGAKSSQHLLGKAADIVIEGYAPKQVFDIIEQLQDKGLMTIGGLHAYDSFTHFDIRGHLARW